jgi:hypothetical protein
MIRRVGLLIGLGALTALAAAPAQAYVYWANTSTGTIGRAGNEGTPVEPEFIRGLSGPNSLAVDAGHVYWSDYSKQAIGRASLSGTDVEPEWIKLPYQPDGVAVNATDVYWLAGAPGKVGRAGIDGSNPSFEFIKGVAGACGLAVDSGHLYWPSGNFGPGAIARVGLDGKNLESEFVQISQVDLLCGVAVNTTSVFWTDQGVGSGTNIGRASLISPKTSVDPSYLGAASGPCGIAVFGSKLYWPNSGTATIGRANTDATSPEYEFIPTGAEPKTICGIAVDSLAPPAPPTQPPGQTAAPADKSPPLTRIDGGPGGRIADGIAKFRFSSSEPGSSFECRLDRGKAKRCASPKRYTALRPGRHVFRVWATDQAGNKDATPAKRRFKVPAA